MQIQSFPRISVVTISFNQGRFLEQAIRSVTEQNYPNLEYIVVDPGSTDGSREIIDRYRGRIDKLILEPDSGPPEGLNKGFSVATGEILGFLNADDLLLPGAINRVVQAFENSDSDVVSGHAYIINEDAVVLRRFYSRRYSVRAHVYGAAMIAQPSTFFRASCFRKIGGFNTANCIAWDGECWVEMALAGAKFSRLNSFLSCYRVYPGSVSGSGALSGEQAKRYRERIFHRVMERSRGGFDVVLFVWNKVFEYVTHPEAFIERLVRGRTIGIGSPKAMRQQEIELSTTYLIYMTVGMPIFAVPARPRSLRRHGLARYQPSTWKRATYKATLLVNMAASLDRAFCRRTTSPLKEVGEDGFDLDNWLREAQRFFFGLPELSPVIVWPKQLERERVYVHLLYHGEPIAFAKISLRQGPDGRLGREASVLRVLQQHQFSSFRCPRLILEGVHNGFPYLLLEPLPRTARPIARKSHFFPHECIKEYAGPPLHVRGSDVSQLSWWSRYQARVDQRYSRFNSEMLGMLDNGIDVCRAHGDLSGHNIFYDERMLWICDWEESVRDAPVKADLLSFEMSMNISAVRADPVGGAQRFTKRYLEGREDADRLAVMMVLAFRHTALIDDASLIMEHWDARR